MASELQQQPAPPVTLLQLEDVYDIATRVSEEFQVLASQFGGSRLSTIIPMVLDTLEHLENAITANQQLEIRVRKLMLGNDTLMKEKEEASTELKDLSQMREFLKKEQRERQRLTEEVGRMRTTNENLNRKMDQLKSENDLLRTTSLHTVVEESEASLNGSDPPPVNESANGIQDSFSNGVGSGSEDDVMALPRVNRRLSLVQSELEQTRHKLLSNQSSLQSVMTENCALKLQLEEYKAELSLKSIETLRVTQSCSSCSPSTDSEPQSPRFYKDDLIRVLKERNELKEEIDNLRDQLSLAQTEVKKNHSVTGRFTRRSRSRTPPARRRSSTRVREIFDSICIDEYEIINQH